MLCLLALSRYVHFFIEQPSSSLMLSFPYLSFLEACMDKHIGFKVVRLPGPQSFVSFILAFLRVDGATLTSSHVLSSMGLYGHFCLKPTMLVGSALGTYISGFHCT